MADISYRFIINPISGSKKLDKLIHLIEAEFSGVDHELCYTKYAGHATELAEDAAGSGIDVVVSAGGDGTINEVATGIVGTATALGILPRGSGNGFARSLTIPLDMKSALDLLLKKNIYTIDTVRINDSHFFGVAGVGFDSIVAHAFQAFGTRGPLPYFYVGVKEYFKYNYPEIQIETENRSLVLNPLIVSIANTSQFGNGAQIAPQADFQDGLLDICIIKKLPIMKSLKSVSDLFSGKIAGNEFYETFRAKKIRILNTSTKGMYHMDGEPRLDGFELNIEILPKTLKVIRS